jgi:hypothetical protein
MATLAGLRCNEVIAKDFERLTKAGKVHKVAMPACIRKLLTIQLSALFRGPIHRSPSRKRGRAAFASASRAGWGHSNSAESWILSALVRDDKLRG